MNAVMPRNEIQRSLRAGTYSLPSNLKALPDLMGDLDDYVDLLKKGEDYEERATQKWLCVLAEVERLQSAEFDLIEKAKALVEAAERALHFGSPARSLPQAIADMNTAISESGSGL